MKELSLLDDTMTVPGGSNADIEVGRKVGPAGGNRDEIGRDICSPDGNMDEAWLMLTPEG